MLRVSSGTAAPSPGSLHAALRAAGVGHADAPVALRRRHDGWPVADPFTGGRLAAYVDARDARALTTALPPGLRLDRGGGEPVVEIAVPDRGGATRRLVWPLLRARLADWIAEHRARPVGLDVVRDGEVLRLRVRLAAHPHGDGATPLPRPHLEAPVLPPVPAVDGVDSPLAD